MSHDRTDGRPPPADLDTEAALLAAMLIAPVAVVPVVVDLVGAEDFYSEAHRLVFEAIVAVEAEHGAAAVDAPSVGNWLKGHDRIAKVGGMGYVVELLNAATSVSNAGTHARLVRDLSIARRLMTLCQRTAAMVHLEPGNLGDILAEHEQAVAELSASRANAGTFETVGALAAKVFRELHAHSQSGNAMRGTSTGFDRYDRMTGGLHPGDLTVIAGRPGMGKTAWALAIAERVATQTPNSDVLAFSLEMPSDQYATRILCAMSKMDLRAVRTGELGNRWSAFMTAVEHVQTMGLHIDDRSRSFAQMRAAIRQKQVELANKKRKVRLVVVDYLGLMKKGKAERNDIAIGDITRSFKAAAKELGVPIFLLAQLNRQAEHRGDKRPTMADLRESGDIEQDADNIALLYRDEYYDADTEERNIAEVIIAKQRNGPSGTVKVRFDKEFTRFDNLAEWETP